MRPIVGECEDFVSSSPGICNAEWEIEASEVDVGVEFESRNLVQKLIRVHQVDV
jgi:hypothetical protein